MMDKVARTLAMSRLDFLDFHTRVEGGSGSYPAPNTSYHSWGSVQVLG